MVLDGKKKKKSIANFVSMFPFLSFFLSFIFEIIHYKIHKIHQGFWSFVFLFLAFRLTHSHAHNYYYVVGFGLPKAARPFGKWNNLQHSKVLLFRSNEGLRVVISGNNLTEHQWTEGIV